MKRYTVFAMCRKEGSLGEYTRMDVRMDLDDKPHPLYGSMLLGDAIRGLRSRGYETLYVETIEEIPV